jgi:DHA2 family methylenomycin A resistance protein-like MFS transporter
MLGLWIVSGIGAQIALPLLIGGLALAGVGMGLSSAGMQTAAVESVASREAGVAAGIFSTSRYVGSIVGSSVLPMLYGIGAGTEGFDRVLYMVLVAAIAAVLASLLIEHRPQVD